MALSKSPKSLEERVAENAEIKAEKKRQRRLQQKRDAEQRRRERLKAAEEQTVEEQKLQLKRERALADSDIWRQRPPGFLWPGEVVPRRDASSLFEVDAVCDRWLKALGLKHQTETLAEREERILVAYFAAGEPFLSASTGELIDENGEPWQPDPALVARNFNFADVWELLPGATTTQASMPDLSGLPKAGVEDSKPRFVPTLVPKKAKPASASEPDGVSDSTPIGVPSDTCSGTAFGGMTFQQEKELMARRELEREQQDWLRAQAQLENAPVALFQSEIGSTN